MRPFHRRARDPRDTLARQPVHARLLLPVLLLVGTVAAVVSSLGAPLVPTIAEVHDVSPAAAQWTLTLSLLVAAVGTPVLGRLGDGRWRKRCIVSVLVLVLLGSVLAALPLGFEALLVGRALQGLGLGLSPLVIAVARDHLPADRVRPAVAKLSITTVAGVGFGYPLTGVLTDAFGLQAGFWFGVGLSALAAGLALWVVPSPHPAPAQRFDLLGAGLLGAGLAGMLVALSEGAGWGLSSWRLPALVVASLVVVTAWVRHQLRTAVPLVELRLLRHRPVLTAAVTGVLTGVGMYLLISLVTRFVQTPPDVGSYGFDATVAEAGLVLLPFSLASIAGSKVAPWLARHLARAAVLPAGCLVVLVASLGFALVHSSLWQVFVAMAVAGLGVGCIFAALPGLILAAVPASETGSAMGFNQVLRMVGFSVGSALSAAILELHTRQGDELPTETGYVAASLTGVAICALAVALSTVLPGRQRRATDSGPGAVDAVAVAAEASIADALPAVRPKHVRGH